MPRAFSWVEKRQEVSRASGPGLKSLRQRPLEREKRKEEDVMG